MESHLKEHFHQKRGGYESHTLSQRHLFVENVTTSTMRTLCWCSTRIAHSAWGEDAQHRGSQHGLGGSYWSLSVFICYSVCSADFFPCRTLSGLFSPMIQHTPAAASLAGDESLVKNAQKYIVVHLFRPPSWLFLYLLCATPTLHSFRCLLLAHGIILQHLRSNAKPSSPSVNKRTLKALLLFGDSVHRFSKMSRQIRDHAARCECMCPTPWYSWHYTHE